MQWKGQRVTVSIDAELRQMQIFHDDQILKTHPLKGVVGHLLSFEDFVEHMATQARAQHRLRSQAGSDGRARHRTRPRNEGRACRSILCSTPLDPPRGARHHGLFSICHFSSPSLLLAVGGISASHSLLSLQQNLFG
jgi:hypothetical protein